MAAQAFSLLITYLLNNVQYCEENSDTDNSLGLCSTLAVSGEYSLKTFAIRATTGLI